MRAPVEERGLPAEVRVTPWSSPGVLGAELQPLLSLPPRPPPAGMLRLPPAPPCPRAHSAPRLGESTEVSAGTPTRAPVCWFLLKQFRCRLRWGWGLERGRGRSFRS